MRAAVADACTVYPGCDGTPGTCTTKFSNFVNFGGYPFVPPNNPTLQAINSPAPSAGKK